MINANDYKDDVYSQNGEDGIIAFLLTRIERTGFVIEFGAADGVFCSNTAALWKDQGCEALLIESDPELYRKLSEMTRSRSPQSLPSGAPWGHVDARKAVVANIDDFTTRVADVCSIDVDGNDYHIAWRMQARHKIVLVEHNPTVPPHVDMIGIEGAGYGSSAKSIVHIMEGKGYTLVGCTRTNLVFLHGDHRDTFVHDLPTLFDYSALNYVATAYDGTYDMIGPWDYGLSRPGDLRLTGRDDQRSRVYDDDTLERIRQMLSLEQKKRKP